MMVVFVGFGYAKPVPTDPRRFTSRYADMLVAAAGPLMNLLLAVITVNVFVQGLQFGWYSPYETLPQSMLFVARINLLLMVFNLLPIPPLDGSRVISALLPNPLAYRYNQLEQYGFFILIGLMFIGGFTYIVWPIVGLVLSWMSILSGLNLIGLMNFIFS
jgi:Zn-dependent protease